MTAPAHGPPRPWNTGCYFELCDGIGVGEYANRAELRLVIIYAIEREIIVRCRWPFTSMLAT